MTETVGRWYGSAEPTGAGQSAARCYSNQSTRSKWSGAGVIPLNKVYEDIGLVPAAVCWADALSMRTSFAEPAFPIQNDARNLRTGRLPLSLISSMRTLTFWFSTPSLAA